MPITISPEYLKKIPTNQLPPEIQKLVCDNHEVRAITSLHNPGEKLVKVSDVICQRECDEGCPLNRWTPI